VAEARDWPAERRSSGGAWKPVDAHHHVWDLAVRAQPWLERPGNEALRRAFSEADLRPLAAAEGVTATVVVQTVTDPAETLDLLALAADSDLIAGVVGWADLQAPGVADALAALQARPYGGWLRGIRHPVLTEDDPGWLRRPAVLRGLAAVGAAGLCYDLVLPADQLPAAIDAAAACPSLTFVLDHLGNPEIGPQLDQQWASAVRQLAALPNTVCKLSGILSEPPPAADHLPASRPRDVRLAVRPSRSRPPDGPPDRPAPDSPPPDSPPPDSPPPDRRRSDVTHLVPCYETVVEAFGPDRLMFGTDWPVCTLSASYATVVAAAQALTAALSPADHAAIFEGTARRVYRLGPAALPQ
jgi:L-fuconolactonase